MTSFDSRSREPCSESRPLMAVFRSRDGGDGSIVSTNGGRYASSSIDTQANDVSAIEPARRYRGPGWSCLGPEGCRASHRQRGHRVQDDRYRHQSFLRCKRVQQLVSEMDSQLQAAHRSFRGCPSVRSKFSLVHPSSVVGAGEL